MMEYTIIIEKASDNYAVYVPDPTGCVSTRVARDEAIVEIEAVMALQIESL